VSFWAWIYGVRAGGEVTGTQLVGMSEVTLELSSGLEIEIEDPAVVEVAQELNSDTQTGIEIEVSHGNSESI